MLFGWVSWSTRPPPVNPGNAKGLAGIATCIKDGAQHRLTRVAPPELPATAAPFPTPNTCTCAQRCRTRGAPSACWACAAPSGVAACRASKRLQARGRQRQQQRRRRHRVRPACSHLRRRWGTAESGMLVACCGTAACAPPAVLHACSVCAPGTLAGNSCHPTLADAVGQLECFVCDGARLVIVVRGNVLVLVPACKRSRGGAQRQHSVLIVGRYLVMEHSDTVPEESECSTAGQAALLGPLA